MAEIQFIGLREIAAAFRKLEPDTRKVLPRKYKEVAEIVAQAAARKVPSKSGDAIASIVSIGTATGAAVKGGGSGAPYYGWLDFGSRTPRFGNPRSVGPWTSSGTGPKTGRFIYPAIEEKREEIGLATLEAVEMAAKEAGFH